MSYFSSAKSAGQKEVIKSQGGKETETVTTQRILKVIDHTYVWVFKKGFYFGTFNFTILIIFGHFGQFLAGNQLFDI